MRGRRKADYVYHHAESDGNLTVETNEDETTDEAEILKRYARIGEAVCGIASQGDDAEVRRKGDGTFAIYAVKKNKVTLPVMWSNFLRKVLKIMITPHNNCCSTIA